MNECWRLFERFLYGDEIGKLNGARSLISTSALNCMMNCSQHSLNNPHMPYKELHFEFITQGCDKVVTCFKNKVVTMQ